jgi:4-alpha-glucanotransferase
VAATTRTGSGHAAALRKLAEQAGILSSFVDQGGRLRRTRDDTRVALLAAMGIDAADATAARHALEQWLEDCARALLPPVGVAYEGALSLRFEFAAPNPASLEWTMALYMEDGGVTHASGRARARLDGAFVVPLRTPLPAGYHHLEITVAARKLYRHASQLLVVAPRSCPSPASVLHGQRVVGITANLYSVRSASNWGAGNLRDLTDLVSFAAQTGSAFVGVNPLHALRNSGTDVSPYSPVSRLFRNPLYLDVEAIPEFRSAPAARERAGSKRFQRELARLRAARHLDYGAASALQRPILELLHDAFVTNGERDDPRRHAAYHRYVAAQGSALEDFATFVALDEHLARTARGTGDWHRWPEQYRDPRSEAVASFRAQNMHAIGIHCWLQFELDRQLEAVCSHARAAGLPIGVYQDLAIGTAPSGSDPWVFGDLFVRGACVGAPPDPLAPDGQNWGLPPIDPRRLAERGFDYWIALVRAALRHSGALRIDHILGLFRQFWIPDGRTGRDGAYVRFPSEQMLAVIAIESTRSGAIVVGEDLGTVPPEVGPALERWGILSSRVLYFERDSKGEFNPASEYPRMALTTATTHDLPTLAGFWSGRDIGVRSSLGLTRDRAGRSEHAARTLERAALLRRLRDDALLPSSGDAAVDDLAVRSATHAFLRRSPSWLVGLALDDLVGEQEPVNVPGVGPERFSSWTRRLAMPLEAIREDPAVRRALGIERDWATGAGDESSAHPAPSASQRPADDERPLAPRRRPGRHR